MFKFHLRVKYVVIVSNRTSSRLDKTNALPSHLKCKVAFDQERCQVHRVGLRFEMAWKPDIRDPDIGVHREDGLKGQGGVSQFDFARPLTELADGQGVDQDGARFGTAVARNPRD